MHIGPEREQEQAFPYNNSETVEDIFLNLQQASA
jgi:hypothetical protein